MSFTKFIHMLFKHHQASQRPSMECKRVLKNPKVDLQT